MPAHRPVRTGVGELGTRGRRWVASAKKWTGGSSRAEDATWAGRTVELEEIDAREDHEHDEHDRGAHRAVVGALIPHASVAEPRLDRDGIEVELVRQARLGAKVGRGLELVHTLQDGVVSRGHPGLAAPESRGLVEKRAAAHAQTRLVVHLHRGRRPAEVRGAHGNGATKSASLEKNHDDDRPR